MSMAERRRRCRDLARRHYGHLPSREEMLDAAVRKVLRPSDVLLDAGCGATLACLRRYRAEVRVALGVDLCAPTPGLDGRNRAIVGNLERLPLATASVDVIVSRSVVEHLERPREVFAEFARVLRAGGHVIFTTPNFYYYSCLVARLTPRWIKAFYFRRVFAEDAYDFFPVRYRANTPAALNRLANGVGLVIEELRAVPHYPYYLMFSPLLFRLGMLYDAAIEALRLPWLRSTWLVVMRKP